MNKIYYPDNDAGYWRDVPGYSGVYQVSRAGTVRRIFKNGVRDLNYYRHKGHGNQWYVKIGKSNTPVHRLVYQVWKGMIPENKRVYHINGILSDNRADNLELIDVCSLGRKFGGRASRCKQVFKISESGEEVEIYRSAREAAKQNYMSHQAVIDRCHKKVANEFALNGFTFRFEDEDKRRK